MILAAMLMAAAMNAPADEFFIISSVDLSRNRVVLKRPTEVSVLATIAPATTIRGEHGETLHANDLRSGDTIYAVVKTQPDGVILVSVRRGPMTLEELRRRYLSR